jgi:hypothetical protein
MNLETVIDLKSYPKDEHEWWAWLESEWDNILTLIKKFTKDKKLIKQIIKCKECKDHKIKDFFENIWESIPVSTDIAKHDGGLVFAELVSELELLEPNFSEQKQINEDLFRHRYKQANPE